MKGSIIPLTGSRGEQLVDILYESPTTRVSRHGYAGANVICKETLGPDAAQRLRHEKNILARLVGVAGVARLAAGFYPAGVLALHDCGGMPLAQLLRAGPLELGALLTLAPQLARTLAEVHRAGVVHRDINPANIVLAKDSEPVLIDFGLAMPAEQHSGLTHQDDIVGTPGYVAPEQTGRTGRTVDQRADLYALGATLYEMATGKLPFEAQDTLQLIHDHLVRAPVAPSQVDPRVPRGLSDIILRLLAKAPEQRFQSAEGLLHDLQRLTSELEEGLGGVFSLGERDFPARLAPPEQLVGRHAESALLRTALADALHTPRRTVLIEGAAGVGKSALINELRPVVAAAGGWYVHCKFDQYQKDAATAGALTQALRALGRLLLAQSGDELAAQRQRILQALGRSAGLMTRVSPEFALLLGAQPEVPEIDPRQAELRLQQAIVSLLGAIASAERPLVIVLDDLQWAGAMPLRTFERLMGEPGLRGLLLVGAYRAEEADADHVLSPMLAQWREQPQRPMHIALANLTPAGMGELTGQMLRLAPAPAHELARAVSALTGGNPFDTVEMINALRRDGALSLGEQGWHWDEAAIRRFVGGGNVVYLLAGRIGRLPTASRELLEFMSCLGDSVERKLLGAAAGLAQDELRERLRVPLEDGLLVADPSDGGQDDLHFRHDRVQQAVLDAMDDTQRGQRQLAMARRLACEPAFGDDAAQQYLACVCQLTEPAEQRRAAQLFHSLARKAASAAIYLLAERYLAAAGGLLAAINDPADAALRGAIDVDRHAALYSLGQLDESDALYTAIQARTADPLDLVEPACLQMRSLDMRGLMNDTMQLGRHLLTQLGLDVPPDYTAPDTSLRLDALKEWVRQDGQLDHSNRAQIRDKRLRAIAKLLDQMVRSAYYLLDSKAFRWLLLESQRLWAEHGPCPELVAGLARASGMLISLRQDYRTAFDIARHVVTVGEALGYEPQTSEARFMFSGYACAWFEPLENAFHHATRAYEGVQARGDVSYACYVHVFLYATLLDIAPTIDICDAEIETGMVLCQRTGNIHAEALHMCERRLLRALGGRTKAPDSFDDEQFNEREFLARVGHLPYVQLAYFHALHALILGDEAALIRHTPGAISIWSGIASGYFRVLHLYLCTAMARAWQVQRDPSIAGRESLLAELDTCRHWLAGRAADQPYNFLHLLRLVEAEQAWALGDLWRAAAAFDAAVLEAESRQRAWHRALITERAGLFHMARGLAGTGRYLLSKACGHYQAWGASAKVAQMQRDHAFPRAPGNIQDTRAGMAGHSVQRSSNSVPPDALDLVGVLRASQALSSETSLDRLTTRVTEVLAALSGATKVLVLSWSDEQWWLLAPAPGESSIPVGRAAERGLLPLSAVGYAERTGEALVVDDAPRDDRFARDPYFAGVPLCSLLVAPIASQGTTRAMLLLENRQGRAAFNAQRLDAVMLIAGQLAVSLANAQIYESLERRVRFRTRELQETQAQLVTTARRAGMAEIANNVLHNVGNVLNSINVSTSVARRTVGNSRIEGLERAVALMNEHEHEHDLGRFIDSDPRGKALLAYLNDLVDALRTERVNTLGDLDRLARSVDHMIYVVANQQSHAGPSSVLEMARPQELLEEALHLSAQAIARCGVAVVRQYEEVPATALDKQRLVQILVNLIGNAALAMEGLPEPLRRLTLGTGLVQSENGEGGERLCIRVQDAGEGIAPENLTRIFAHGFTTRKNGHGFGLHSSALAAMEMGGRLTVHSDGHGQGAVFTVELPVDPIAPVPSAAAL